MRDKDFNTLRVTIESILEVTPEKHRILRVFIASPYGSFVAPDGRLWTVRENVDVARDLCSIAMKCGAAPFAPHLIYPQFMPDTGSHRRAAIAAGCAFMLPCDFVYFANGEIFSEGMQDEHAFATMHKIPMAFEVSDEVTG